MIVVGFVEVVGGKGGFDRVFCYFVCVDQENIVEIFGDGGKVMVYGYDSFFIFVQGFQD